VSIRTALTDMGDLPWHVPPFILGGHVENDLDGDGLWEGQATGDRLWSSSEQVRGKMREIRKVGCLRFLTNLLVLAGCVVELCSETHRQQSRVRRKPGRSSPWSTASPSMRSAEAGSGEKPGVFRRYGMRKENPDLVRRQQAKVLDRVIGDVLINQESKKRTIENIDEKVEQRVKDLEKKSGPGREWRGT